MAATAPHEFDIVFVGHMCYDEIVPFGGAAHVAPGSAVLCGAMAAARIGKNVAVVTRLAPKDDAMLSSMRQAGIRVFAMPSDETTYMQVLHPTADVDVRQMFQRRSAGYFRAEDMPRLAAANVHLAGVTDQEFTLEFMSGLKADLNGTGAKLSTDMQSFVRQVDGASREIFFRDVPAKRQIASLMDRLKLDAVEAKILTGEDDLERAARQVEQWGCGEIVITQARGVLARAGGKTHVASFSNSSVVGRTGRGDTTFAAYMAWRMEHDVAESLTFAAALVSIKMETPGPFRGTLQQVLDRMKAKHS